MPGWSPEIANEFIRRARADLAPLDQIQLQKLVYIAHGWCLAITGQPLTGDRPEAFSFGPMYRRLADSLATYGLNPVDREIDNRSVYPDFPISEGSSPARAELDDTEVEIIEHVYRHYGNFSSAQLSNVTREHRASPWREVYADGAGENCEISHARIRNQFMTIAQEIEARL